MKRLLGWLLMACLMLGCVRELPVEVREGAGPYPEDAKVTVQFSMPAGEKMVSTRALGEKPKIDSLYVAVFGSSGYLKEYVKAFDLNNPSFTGNDTVLTFKATLTLSEKERSVHFLANGPSILDFGYNNEILPSLLSADEGQAFWQMRDSVLIETSGDQWPDGTYKAKPSTNDQFKKIPLIRNFAKITVTFEPDANFVPDSFAVFNVPSKGSMVPCYKTESGDLAFVKNYQDYGFIYLTDTLKYTGNMPDSVDFVGLPDEWETRKVSVSASNGVYMYERSMPNEEQLPTYVIVHGTYNNLDDPNPTENNGKDYYYKIDLMQGGEYYPVLRNFRYQINIKKILSIGHKSPQAAAASAGSADVSSDITTSHLNDISDGEARLVIQPWMSYTFIKKQNNNSVLHAKFFSSNMNEPNMDAASVICDTLPMPSGQAPVIEKFSIGNPYMGTGTDKGWRTITFSTVEPGDPGTEARSQTIRITGTYTNQYGEHQRLYRDVVISLQPLQQMQLSFESATIPRDTMERLTLNIGIPIHLVESMFPITFTIEPEDLSLTPDNSVDNNNLPVIAKTSISDHAEYAGKRAFQFQKTLSYSEYRSLPQTLDLDGEPIRSFSCYFKTTKKDNATTIWVANEFFSKANATFKNPAAPPLNYFYVEARDENIDKLLVVLQFSGGKVEYQINDNGWVSYSSNSELRLKNGERVYFRGNIKDWSGAGKFKAEGSFNVGGNIASLFLGDFTSEDIAADAGASVTGWKFNNFFQYETGLVDASALLLPMTTLTSSGYAYMFQGCTNLVKAPKLTAQTLTAKCYEYMFQGCSKLKEVTMLGRGTIPGTSLTNWLDGVNATGDFYGYVTTTLSEGGSGVPTGWIDRKEFYVSADAAGTVSYSGSGLLYSKNWEEWTDAGIGSITVAAGDIVRFKAKPGEKRSAGSKITSTGAFSVGGNIMSLAGNNYVTAAMASNAFQGLFSGATTLVSAGALVLPETGLTTGCFKAMFSGCTSLTSVPALAATTLAANCYESMFSGCTTLTARPSLPATTLAENCYKAMFQGCTSLTAAPKLPAETLVTGCYVEMFSGCSNLANVDCSATTNLGDGYTTNWLLDVAATGVFVKDKFAQWTVDDASGIPQGWTVSTSDYFKIKAITKTKITFNYNYEDSGIEYMKEGEDWKPYTSQFQLDSGQTVCIRGNRNNYKNDSGTDEYGTPGSKPIFSTDNKVYISGNIMSLLADKENLSESAFQGAFSKGKTAVSYIDIDPYSDLILPATTMASKCYMQMFRNCTSLTKAPVFTVESTANRCCYNMFRDCSNLDNVSTVQLPAAILSEDCYREMFRQCTKLTSVSTALLPATTLAPQCYQQMFNGCTVLTQAPALPAMNLATSCYQAMFSACTSLEQAPDLPATALTTSCYRDMFNGCTKLSSLRCLAETEINKNNSTTDWMKSVKSTGTFVKKSDITWPRSQNGIPSGWTIVEEP